MTHGLEVLIATDRADAAQYIATHSGVDAAFIIALDEPARKDGLRIENVHATRAALEHPAYFTAIGVVQHSMLRTRKRTPSVPIPLRVGFKVPTSVTLGTPIPLAEWQAKQATHASLIIRS